MISLDFVLRHSKKLSCHFIFKNGWLEMHSNEMIRVCDLVSPRNHLNLFRKTNPVFPDQLCDEDQCHEVHNGQTTSYHTHWCISCLVEKV